MKAKQKLTMVVKEPEAKSLTQAELRAKKRAEEPDTEEIFTPTGRDQRLDAQRAIQSVAFLMEWAIDVGNEDLDGPLAFGLSQALRLCAKKVGGLYELDDIQNEIEASGGDWDKSPAIACRRGR